jgi:hypothetical protein
MGALTPLTSQRRFAQLMTYDLEWVKGKNQSDGTHTLNVRLAGVYDGNRYRGHRSVHDFLNFALSTENRGKRFYGHAAGLYDFMFILEEIMKSERFTVECFTSGSTIVAALVRRKSDSARNVWAFYDSARTFNQKVSDIGEAIGLPKLGDYEGIFEGPIEPLQERNERDCQIPWVALDNLQNALFELGGELRSTAASCAMALFRRRFLKQTIYTGKKLNESARSAYVASRVEVFRPKCDRAFYYDINSSFPHAMTYPCPGNLIRSSDEIPTRDGALYLAHVELTIPEMYLPPIPRRSSKAKRIFFPWGSWEAWLTNVDVELVEEMGGAINSVHEVLEFDPFEDLAEYAKTLYKKRLNAASEFESLVYKLLLNSLYGKFAESEEKERLLWDPPVIACTHKPAHPLRADGVPVCWEMFFPGAWMVSDIVDIPHVHVPISAHITAVARANLYRYLARCKEIYYCDTDSVITSDHLETASELGALKEEGIIHNGEFLAPKLYRVLLEKKGKTEERVRAKGFRSLTYDDFQRLKGDDEIQVQRMLRMRELWRKGSRQPLERTFTKKHQAKLQPKRAPDGVNNTRPWHVSEIDR